MGISYTIYHWIRLLSNGFRYNKIAIKYDEINSSDAEFIGYNWFRGYKGKLGRERERRTVLYYRFAIRTFGTRVDTFPNHVTW